jgi:hypothetical protein
MKATVTAAVAAIWNLATPDITLLPDVTAPDILMSLISQSPNFDIGDTETGYPNITES